MTSPTPHDTLFRHVLGEPEHAASQLRSVLPSTLLADLDLDGLTPVPGSFVDEDLRWRHCDVLFRTRWRGRDAFVHLLVEHQSSPDRWMAWRILQYITRIWDRCRSEQPDATTLPLVIPVVVYHGRRPWRHPTELTGLLDLASGWAEDPATAALVPRFGFLLDDLSGVDEPALRARPLTAPARVTLLLLTRTRTNPGLEEELQAWVADLRVVLDRAGGMALFRAFLTYIELVGEVPPAGLRRLMQQIGPDAEEAYVTTADMLRAEGRAEGEARGRAEGEARGRAEGEARGRAEGEARGRAEALLQLLAQRFGAVPSGVATTVRAAPVDLIETWTTRVLTAGSLDDVLR